MAVRCFIEILGLPADTTWANKPTALCYAAIQRDQRLVEYLLEQGAAVDYTDALGYTPLHYAALGGCVHVLARLIAQGAELNAENHAGLTPLAIAERVHDNAACRELLYRYGASLQAQAPLPRRFH